MTDKHIYIHKRTGSHRIVSRRPRHCIDTASDEQTATVRVPTAVALVPLDELHVVLPSQQATEDSHLSNGGPAQLHRDLLADIQVPADAKSEQSDIPEEDDEDTQKRSAIKVSHQEGTEQEALPTAALETRNDNFHHQSGGQSSRLLKAVVLTTRIVMVVIIVLFFLVFPRIVLPKSSPQAAPQLSAGVVATTPVPILGLTIIPDHLDAATGCTFAQSRYRCIITLTLSRNHHNKLKWSISRSGLTATFSPSKGSLWPGHLQQIVIYIYNDCPHSGSLIFSIRGKIISIPWSC